MNRFEAAGELVPFGDVTTDGACSCHFGRLWSGALRRRRGTAADQDGRSEQGRGERPALRLRRPLVRI
jgi:hypothetical protein